MKKGVSENLNLSGIFAMLIIFLGVALMAYMIKVEDEPGALPILLILVGAAWFVFNFVRIKRRAG